MDLLEQLTNNVENSKKQASGLNEVIHIWLEGIQSLVEDKLLQENLVEEYLNDYIKEFLPFTISHSGRFLLKNSEAMNNGRSIIATLPINNNYHMQFPLDKKDCFYEFRSTPCSLHSCKICQNKRIERFRYLIQN